MKIEIQYTEDNGLSKKGDKTFLDGLVASSLRNRGVAKYTGRKINSEDFNKGLLPKETPKKKKAKK